MTETEFKINLLLENLPFRCKYYQGDEWPCLKYQSDDESQFLTCNCDGEISKCDLYDFVNTCNLWKFIVRSK